MDEVHVQVVQPQPGQRLEEESLHCLRLHPILGQLAQDEEIAPGHLPLGHLGLDYTPKGFLLVVQEGGVKVPDYMNSDFAGQQKSCGTCIQTPGLHGQPGRAPHRPPGGCPDLLEAGDTRSSAEGKDSSFYAGVEWRVSSTKLLSDFFSGDISNLAKFQLENPELVFLGIYCWLEVLSTSKYTQ